MYESWTHAISKDSGAHWEQMPHSALPVVGMDGSVTLMDTDGNGLKPLMLYDCISTALCKPPPGLLGDPPIIGVARPSDLSDANLSNWTIDPLNPIVVVDGQNKSVTGYAGPSNLWTTTDDESRSKEIVTNMLMIYDNGKGTATTALFQTKDPELHRWTLKNPDFYPQRGGGGGLFFPLPGASQKSRNNKKNGAPRQPTHLLQTDLAGRGDGVTAFILGEYDSSTGGFSPSGNASLLDGAGMSFIEIGYLGAQTSDPPRLQYVGWMSIARSISVVRELFFDSEEGILRSMPVDSVQSLRSLQPIVSKQTISIAAGATYQVVSSGAEVADVELDFESTDTASFSIGVLGGSSKDSSGRMGLVFNVQIEKGSVLVSGECAKPARGKVTPPHCIACPGVPFRLPEGEDSLRFRILVDITVVEFFAGDGRSVCSSSLARAPSNSAVYVQNGGKAPLPLTNATAWDMGCGFGPKVP